jgi:hypothetical protein
LLLPLRLLPEVEPPRFEGCVDGLLLGCCEGFVDGCVDGLLLGCCEGLVEGWVEGLLLGCCDGLVPGLEPPP